MGNNRLLTIIVTAVLFSVYCFVFGESGILERYSLLGENATVKDRIVALENQNSELALLYENYRKGEYSKDDILKAGFVGEGERLILFKNILPPQPGTPGMQYTLTPVNIEIRYLRILWALVSVTVIILLMLKKER